MWPYLIGPYIPATLVMQGIWFMYRCWAAWDVKVSSPGGEQVNSTCSLNALPNNVVYLRRAFIPRIPTNAGPKQPSVSNVIPLPTATLKR
jgi:hypothetical protein